MGGKQYDIGVTVLVYEMTQSSWSSGSIERKKNRVLALMLCDAYMKERFKVSLVKARRTFIIGPDSSLVGLQTANF